MTLSKTATALIASTAALFALPAMAGSTDDVTSRSLDVSIAGYDLSDPADAKTVLSKIELAAKRVCSHSTARQTLRERAEEFTCRTNAVTAAVAKLDVKELTAAMERGDAKL